ncbi:MAG: hypothetical protein OHK0040_05540 [bacterium]
MIKTYLGKIGKKIYKYLIFTAFFSVFFLSAFEIFFGYYQGRKNAEKMQEQLLSSLSLRAVKSIEDVKSSMKLTITSKGILEKGLTERFGFYLRKMLANNPAIIEATALDVNGKEVAVESRIRLSVDKKDRSKEEFFKESITGKVFQSKVYLLYNTKPYITISMPISLYSKKYIGVLAVQVSLFELQKFISEMKIGDNGYAYLADTSGNVIAHPVLSYAIGGLNIYNVPNLKGFAKVYEDPTRFHHFIYKNTVGQYVFGSATIIKDFGWLIGVSQPVTDIFRHVIYTIFFLFLFSSVVIFFVFLISGRLAKNITNPIMKLYHTAESVGAGNIGETVDIKTGDEIEELAEEFNKMSLRLKDLYTDMEQKIEDRTKEVVTLFSFTSAISKDIELDEILKVAGEELMFTLDLCGYCICLVNNNSLSDLTVANYKGLQEIEVEKIIAMVKEKEELLIHHEPLIFNNLQTEIANEKGEVCSLGIFPITHLGKLLGVFILFDTKKDAFSDSVKSVVDTCMIQLGITIKNAMLYKETKELSLTDQLTGLANRRYFDAKIDYEFSRFKRYERPFSLLMLDIDHFKKINDTYGHQSGDIILKTLGKIIADFIRKSDFAARYGGEEFAVIMPETSKENACIAAERLRKHIEEKIFKIDVPPYEVHITISLGSSEAAKEMEDWHELVELSDRALYIAKQSGRNRVICL